MTQSTTESADRRPTTRSPNHHESHRTLITAFEPDPRFGKEVDAIIVPTGRPAKTMRHAIELAAELGCTLLALASKSSSARAIAEVARGYDVDLVAIDVHGRPDFMPRLETCYLMENSRFERRTDTSLKRNIGLLLSHLMGWQRIVFLDDDITVPHPQDLRAAAGLTDTHAGVGLNVGRFPDNSVVCHAYRQAGGPQQTFIGGGALAVGTESMRSFFPNIYNEDWFFLLGEKGLRRSAITGTVEQQPYDPFANGQRARAEELGDCLAEGLYSLLDNRMTIRNATFRFWRTFLKRRVDFIGDVTTMVRDNISDPRDRTRMVAALTAAQNQCRTIRPDQCVRYVRAWQADRMRWGRHLDDMHARHARTFDRTGHPVDDLEKLLATLGLEHATRTLRSARKRLDQDPAYLYFPSSLAVCQ